MRWYPSEKNRLETIIQRFVLYLDQSKISIIKGIDSYKTLKRACFKDYLNPLMTTFAHVFQVQIKTKTVDILTSVYWIIYTILAVYYITIMGAWEKCSFITCYKLIWFEIRYVLKIHTRLVSRSSSYGYRHVGIMGIDIRLFGKLLSNLYELFFI